MTNVARYDVTELDLSQCESATGGSDWSYAVGYTVGAMLAHPYIAVSNALDYYFGG
jgi:hypothetical protein